MLANTSEGCLLSTFMEVHGSPLSTPVAMEAAGHMNTPPISLGYGVLIFPMDVATCSSMSDKRLAAESCSTI